MKNIFDQLIDAGLGQLIATRTGELLMKDPYYSKALDHLEHLEDAYLALKLTDEQFNIIDAYISTLKDYENKCNNMTYLAGIKDAISLIQYLQV